MNTSIDKSWIVVIAALILFWPVGLILLFRKLTSDKSATIKSGRLLRIVSYVLIGLGAIWMLSATTGDSSLFVPSILTLGGGIWLRGIAKKTTKTGERYKKYIALVVNQGLTSIDNIASAVGVSYEDAVKDLQKMIDTGYFTGAYIDVTQREIVLPVPQQVSQDTAAVHTQIKVIACASCGANNRVASGQIAECEYCGSPLQ